MTEVSKKAVRAGRICRDFFLSCFSSTREQNNQASGNLKIFKSDKNGELSIFRLPRFRFQKCHRFAASSLENFSSNINSTKMSEFLVKQ